jgi:hypothetical protein
MQYIYIYANSLTMVGIYYDLLIKEDDGIWRFAKRDYRISYLDRSEAPGGVFRTMPDPAYRNIPE